MVSKNLILFIITFALLGFVILATGDSNANDELTTGVTPFGWSI